MTTIMKVFGVISVKLPVFSGIFFHCILCHVYFSVFVSGFVILAERCDSHEAGSDLKHESETSQTVKQAAEEPDGEDRKVESLLDFDGDLDIIHRYAKTFSQSTIKSCWFAWEGCRTG